MQTTVQSASGACQAPLRAPVTLAYGHAITAPPHGAMARRRARANARFWLSVANVAGYVVAGMAWAMAVFLAVALWAL